MLRTAGRALLRSVAQGTQGSLRGPVAVLSSHRWFNAGGFNFSGRSGMIHRRFFLNFGLMLCDRYFSASNPVELSEDTHVSKFFSCSVPNSQQMPRFIGRYGTSVCSWMLDTISELDH